MEREKSFDWIYSIYILVQKSEWKYIGSSSLQKTWKFYFYYQQSICIDDNYYSSFLIQWISPIFIQISWGKILFISILARPQKFLKNNRFQLGPLEKCFNHHLILFYIHTSSIIMHQNLLCASANFRIHQTLILQFEKLHSVLILGKKCNIRLFEYQR